MGEQPALDLELILEASEFLRDRVRRTPVEPSPALEERLGVPVWLKLECLQRTGSFKIRGALFRLSRLSPEERRRGVVTCSAGNHGLALAAAARELGTAARVYVPSSVDQAKLGGILEEGAEVIHSPHPGYDDSQAWALEREGDSGRVWVSAFDDPWIMAGNGGSLALEVLEQVPEARTFLLPVGGGGLAAGFSYAVKERLPEARIIACQHRDSPALALSLERGEAVTRLPAIDTLAAGIEGGIGAGCFQILRSRVDEVVVASEEEILAAVAWVLEHHRYLVEPSAAVSVAALVNECEGTELTPAILVLTGRNLVQGRLMAILGRTRGDTRGRRQPQSPRRKIFG